MIREIEYYNRIIHTSVCTHTSIMLLLKILVFIGHEVYFNFILFGFEEYLIRVLVVSLDVIIDRSRREVLDVGIFGGFYDEERAV